MWQVQAGMGKVSDLYRQRVAEGRLRPDPAQEAVLPHLDRVLADLGDAGAALLRNWIGTL